MSDSLGAAKPVVAVLLFVLFWTWESCAPLIGDRQARLRHAGRNLVIALTNTVVLGLVFGSITVAIALWTEQVRAGVLHQLSIDGPAKLLAALVLLDSWMYLWHRLNHRVPLLWRFHRMHHSDPAMDVSTATRFHLGEHTAAATLRLGVIPLLGLNVLELLSYECLMIAITMFHHANISLGPLDRPLRWLIVTPRMHQIHHSRQRCETDSNYSVLFSVWDRLFQSYQMRSNPQPIELGLDGYDDDHWQSVAGMLRTPFTSPPNPQSPTGSA